MMRIGSGAAAPLIPTAPAFGFLRDQSEVRPAREIDSLQAMLLGVHLKIAALRRVKRGMSSAFHNAAGFNHQNLFGASNCRKAGARSQTSFVHASSTKDLPE